MCGVYPGGVRQGHQFVVQRVVEVVGQFLTGETDRREQIRTADVADEQSVAGQDTVGLDVTWVLVDHDAHGLRRMAGGVAEFKLEFAE